jgi:hypothetical protein
VTSVVGKVAETGLRVPSCVPYGGIAHLAGAGMEVVVDGVDDEVVDGLVGGERPGLHELGDGAVQLGRDREGDQDAVAAAVGAGDVKSFGEYGAGPFPLWP